MSQSGSAGDEPIELVRGLMLTILHSLVDQPDVVDLEPIDDNGTTLLRLRVAREDIGKVIGKQGRTARSLRTVLGAVGMKVHHRFALDIIERE